MTYIYFLFSQRAEDLYQDVGYIPRGDILSNHNTYDIIYASLYVDTNLTILFLYFSRWCNNHSIRQHVYFWNIIFNLKTESVLYFISLKLFCFPECNVTCPDGYTVLDDCSGCELTDICLAENPCLNGDTCYLVRAPNDYRCDATRCKGSYLFGS